MTVQYLTNDKGKKTGVVLSIKDWDQIRKKLDMEEFYNEFRESVRQVKKHQEGKITLKNARDLINEL